MRIDELEPRPTHAEPIDIPPELHASVRRHQAHLAELVANLRAAGLREDMVETSVRGLVDSYARELTTAIRAMAGETHHG